MKKKIVLSIPSSFAASNLIDSGFIKKISSDVAMKSGLLIFSALYKDNSFINSMKKYNVLVQNYPSSQSNFLSRLFQHLAKLSLYSNNKNNSTIIWENYSIKKIQNSKIKLFKYKCIRFIGSIISHDNWMKLSVIFDSLCKSHFKIYREFKPDAVLTCAPGVYDVEKNLICQSLKNKIPVYSILMSWDHLTSKCKGFYKVDKMLVWNDIMQREAVERFNYDKNDVFSVGVPQWDIYADSKIIVSKEDFFSRYDFDNSKRLLLFATEGPDIYTDQHNVAALIIEAVKKNRIPNSQLLIRLHPHDSMSKYENLKNYSNVKIEYPYEKTNNNGVGLNFAFGKQKRKHLANSLYHSDVVISVASTIAIEACIFQKPIIDIGFECDNEMQIVNSSKEIYSLTHYNNFTNFGANDIAFSRYELIDLINENLKFPEQKQKNRSDAMKAFAKKIDGQSMARSIDALQSFLKIEKNSNG